MTEAAEAEKPKRALFAGAARYSAGNVLAFVGSVARVALTARVLSNEDAGVWLGLQLVLGYGANLHFGVLFGMMRNVPLLRSRGDEAEASEVVRTSFTFVSLASAIGAAGAVPVCLWFAQASTRVSVELAVLLAASLVRSFYQTLLKTESKFAELGAVGALGGVMSIVALPLIARFGIDGAIMAMGLQYGSELVYMAVLSGRQRVGMRASVLRAQLGIGILTLLSTVGSVLLTSIDRTVMLRTVGPAPTGLYFLGANVLVILPALAALPFAVLSPKYFEWVGRGDDLMPLLRLPMMIAARGFAPLLVLGAALVDPVIGTFFARLDGGQNATLIAIGVSYVLVLTGFAPNVFYALDRQLPSVGMVGLSCALGLGAASAAARLGLGISGIAAGAGVGVLSYHVLTTVGAAMLIGRTFLHGLALVGRSLVPGLALGAAFFALRAVLVRFMPGGAWARAGVLVVVFSALGGPLLLRAARELRELRE